MGRQPIKTSRKKQRTTASESDKPHIMLSNQSTVPGFFRRIIAARDANAFILRENQQDKEFHFQNWVKQRLTELGVPFEQGGRNTYPDFRIVPVTEGYEVKGLAYPGRVTDFDSNSQVPTGYHNGRSIYYVFGRYPAKPDSNEYPVTDLVLCHGDFLNADHEYRHENKSFRGFGSYGDILVRDRKMYVVPTPFALARNVAHHFTLILAKSAHYRHEMALPSLPGNHRSCRGVSHPGVGSVILRAVMRIRPAPPNRNGAGHRFI